MSDKVNIIMHTKTEDGFIAQHPQTNIEMVEGLDKALKDKASQDYVDAAIGKVPAVFHDKEDDSVQEVYSPTWFGEGISICNHRLRSSFPSIDKSGISITFIGNNSNYGQIYIANSGEMWSRRSLSKSSWGNWYSSKKEIDKKADVAYVDDKTGNLSKLKTEDKSSLVNAINEINTLMPPFVDVSGSPGSKSIKIGNGMEGYFGFVSSNELISGDELASKVGVTQGIAQHSTTPWHKFAYKNKILFVAQKTIRSLISWDHLNDKGVVYGNTIIEIDGVKYKVRLLQGALTDPSDYSASDRGAKGSEWNRLIAPLSHQRKDNSWDYPKYMESDLQDWETYLDDKEMTVRDVDGRRSWCQEVGGDGSAYRVGRGFDGVSSSGTLTSSYRGSDYGWRPVLEVI